MKYEEMFKRCEFMYEDSDDIAKDKELVEKNIDIHEEKEKYAELALEYLEENISKMAPITLLTNLGLLSLGESLGLIRYPRKILQFELDFMLALVIKYSNMKVNYSMDCSPDKIDKLLKAIRIYIFCQEHELHKNSMEAYRINTHYRTGRIMGFDDRKGSIISEFCEMYDSGLGKDRIKMTKVMQFIIAVNKLILERLESISGKAIYLEEQYKFYMFSASDIKEICREIETDYYKTVMIISKFCCRIGDLRTYKVEEIFLDNPINDKFVIMVEPGVFFLPNVNIIAENLFQIIEKILEYDKHDKERYFEVRTDFLEKKTASIVMSKFSNKGQVFLNSQWDDSRHGENDATLIYENYAVIFEDKSGKINRNTNKGILKSAYRDNKDLIEEPSEQAFLFANLLEKNFGSELVLKIKGGRQNIIDLKKVNSILKIGVIFEETPLQNMSLGGKKHSPIVSIFQLDNIFQCLKCEEIIDYFIKRSHIEKNIAYHADEYDFLYSYLMNGLNTSEKIYVEASKREQILIPYTEIKPTREILERETWFQTVIDYVVGRAESDWLENVISLLEIPPIVQKQIIRDIWKAKDLVLLDNIEIRNKLIMVSLIEFYDCDTEKEIDEEIKRYSKTHNVLFIAFSPDFEYIVVKRQDVEFCERL